MKNLKIAYVTKENFGDIGQFIQIPREGSLTPTNQSAFFKFYGELGILDCHGIPELGICTFKKRELLVDQLEQHSQTPELLYALDGDFVMPVAPIITKNGTAYPDLTKIRAIHVRQYEGVIFNDGMWHWAPYPSKEISSVIVGFKRGTGINDIIIRDLDEKFQMVE
jgi:ureidoglycolate hydrolase